MPFYLLSFQSKEKRRHTYFSPCYVNSLSLSARLKAMGKKKITQIFQPRSEKITSILNNFMTLLENNVAFSHDINEACVKANLLRSIETVQSIKKGLNELKLEGWLSESEFEFFTKILPQPTNQT
jgi:hypothetical protein